MTVELNTRSDDVKSSEMLSTFITSKDISWQWHFRQYASTQSKQNIAGDAKKGATSA